MPIPTKAYVVESKGAPFVLHDVILDDVGPDEILVEMKYTGLCHTDIVTQQGLLPIGSFPAVLGHEGAGIIRQLGTNIANKSLKEGDVVFLSFRSCYECPPCVNGNCGACHHATEYNFVRSRLDTSKGCPISLPDGTPVHGQFFGQSSLSKLAIVSERSVVKCDVDLQDLGPLAPLGCGYLTGAGTVANVMKPKETSTIVIMGMGAVGLAALFAAKALGLTKILAVDIVEEKLQLSRELGASHTLNTKEESDLAEGIRRCFAAGADYILDTTGVPSVLQAAIWALGHGGTLALVGAMPPGTKLEFDALDLMQGCKRIMGVIEAYSDPQEIIPRLVQWHKDGKFPVEKLAMIYPAEEMEKALADLKAGKVIKPILKWDTV
ncbi:chaperonin 10-like protein [Aspergillus karnatakaensis]|uniref:NAD(P)-dependent alcohol dehydrogenase n=1 Tax=Aspergillus karnatakaensis TaxID=1810916 RepID=UPI003CCDCDF5